MQLTALLLSALIAGAAPAPGRDPSAAKRPRLAVMPLSADSLPAETRALLGNLLADDVAARGAHEVLGPDEAFAVLVEAGKVEASRCADVICAFEVASTLNNPLTLFGRIARLGDDFVVELRLVDSLALRVIKRSHVTAGPNASGLDNALRQAVAGLFEGQPTAPAPAVPPLPAVPASVLPTPTPGMAATLRVSSSVAGASIFIDDRLVGVTPAVVQVDAGPHQLAVEKQDHTAYNERLNLAPGDYKTRSVIIKNVGAERSARRNRILLGSLMTAFSIAGVATGILLMRSGFHTLEDGATADEALAAMGQLFGGEMLTIYGTLLIAGGIALLVTTPRMGAVPTHLNDGEPDDSTGALVGTDTGALLQLRWSF